MSHTIELIHAHEILDSRGNPTVQVSVMLTDGTIGVASVPSGASTGEHEALELRDGDKKRYGGLGVLKAVRNVNKTIQKALRGMDVTHQREIDERLCLLDGTPNKSRLGANAILGVSLACAHASAKAQKLPLYKSLRQTFDLHYKTFRLPIPTFNVFNGGAHAGWIVDFQEFMIVPAQRRFKERLRCGAEIFHTLGKLLSAKGHHATLTLKGDEGGYGVPFQKSEEALKWMMRAIDEAGYKAGRDVFLALDPAVSELYHANDQKYHLPVEKKIFSRNQMIALWKKWIETYPILSIEDGLDEDDFEGWAQMTAQLGKKITLIGDDFFVTNANRLQKGIEMRAGNGILIKLNQIGTLSETIDAITLAQHAGYKVSVSHRSGETTDTTIADLAVAVNADFIKSGSLSRSERLAKYNRLLEIEEEL
ncbi:MAG: phosphopyruvate hydratase [Patescibacteria group bacterium]